MSEPEGPLDVIPTVNYPPLITRANYLSTKQMIDQVLNEDQEYVFWKLKNMRTGGTMNAYLRNFLQKVEETKERSKFAIDDPHYYNISTDSTTTRKKRTAPPKNDDTINEVPKKLRFAREVFSESLQKTPHPRELDQDEQFKLLVTNLDEQQTNRFEVFHRTSLNKTQVKKLAGMVINQSVTENVRVFLQAIGKVYAGEIIELALHVRQKWLVGMMMVEFDRRKSVGGRLKKYMKKLTLFVENTNEEYDDSVDETESDPFFDDDQDEMKETTQGNKLLKSYINTQEIKIQLIIQYNKLVRVFNTIDVSVEKYTNSPILPEHVREAWRLYQMQSDTLPSAQWRTQGEGNGWMFR